jgi:hypothetical protein
MTIGMYPIASYLLKQKIPPPLGGRSEAEGRVFRGFTDLEEPGYIMAPPFFYDFLEEERQKSQRDKRIVRSTVTRRRTSNGSSKSSVQDRKSGRSRSSVLPKTADGNMNTLVKAYWVKGKPKCKKGYTYNFKRKMCVLDR